MTHRGGYEGVGCLSYDGEEWIYAPADTPEGKDRVLRWVVVIE
ncbi:hypothetical protein O0S10_01610 [Methanocorpusculum sp. MG]|uniref:Uncharacterized protein n=1 Tax=Methanocorpusculum petauri TaxID=3002863 RepID=A0ABT4IFM2_9EURY|nr:hypothetical protein [Methanocorpusculum petauri]MCZ0859923.1 hypothetical protein [Methanocorpusculum petauri]